MRRNAAGTRLRARRVAGSPRPPVLTCRAAAAVMALPAGTSTPLAVKLVRTRVPGPDEQLALHALRGEAHAGAYAGVLAVRGQLYLECGDGLMLQVLEASGRQLTACVHGVAWHGFLMLVRVYTPTH